MEARELVMMEEQRRQRMSPAASPLYVQPPSRRGGGPPPAHSSGAADRGQYASSGASKGSASAGGSERRVIDVRPAEGAADAADATSAADRPMDAHSSSSSHHHHQHHQRQHQQPVSVDDMPSPTQDMLQTLQDDQLLRQSLGLHVDTGLNLAGEGIPSGDMDLDRLLADTSDLGLPSDDAFLGLDNLDIFNFDSQEQHV